VVKSKRMRCARYVALMGEIRNAYKVLLEEPEIKTLLEDVGVYERMI
jgi:hypothetical protein